MTYTKRQPCGDCPFRTNVTPYLPRGRLKEVGNNLLNGNGTFSCHKSLVQAGGDGVDTHCAGALLVLARQTGTVLASGYLRVLHRFHAVSDDYIDAMDASAPTAPVFASFAKADRAQPR